MTTTVLARRAIRDQAQFASTRIMRGNHARQPCAHVATMASLVADFQARKMMRLHASSFDYSSHLRSHSMLYLAIQEWGLLACSHIDCRIDYTHSVFLTNYVLPNYVSCAADESVLYPLVLLDLPLVRFDHFQQSARGQWVVHLIFGCQHLVVLLVLVGNHLVHHLF
jgi:hypothetical protein